MPINSTINNDVVARTSDELKNSVKYFLKCPLLPIAAKLESAGTKTF